MPELVVRIFGANLRTTSYGKSAKMLSSTYEAHPRRRTTKQDGVNPGEYELLIGDSSDAIRLTEPVTIAH